MDPSDKRVTLNCFNPFKKPNHSHVRKGLRTVSQWMCLLVPGTPEISKVCDSCRKELSKLKSESLGEDLSGTSRRDQQGESVIETDMHELPFCTQHEAFQSLNSTLVEIGESPVDKKKAETKRYSSEKARRINVAVKRKLLVNAGSSEDRDSEDDILEHLKHVYESSTSRNQKLMILTLLPASWSIRKASKEFKIPNYLARQAKKLLKLKGPLSTPELRPVKNLPFISKQQHSFMSETKENLLDSEVVVHCDFSENYSFVLQDEAQSYHWTRNQATVHPFVVYFKKEEKKKHFSFVIISDCLEHNTTAVYLFQTKLMHYLKSKFETFPKKIYYFSDGSAAQYKNKKNFLNLCLHYKDFGVEAKWHFSATTNGKGPCDEVGGGHSKKIDRASLQRPYEDQIQTPRLLFEWANQNISNIDFAYVNHEEYIQTEEQLAHRYSRTVAIPGTQKLHAFVPTKCRTKVTVK